MVPIKRPFPLTSNENKEGEKITKDENRLMANMNKQQQILSLFQNSFLINSSNKKRGRKPGESSDITQLKNDINGTIISTQRKEFFQAYLNQLKRWMDIGVNGINYILIRIYGIDNHYIYMMALSKCITKFLFGIPISDHKKPPNKVLYQTYVHSYTENNNIGLELLKFFSEKFSSLPSSSLSQTQSNNNNNKLNHNYSNFADIQQFFLTHNVNTMNEQDARGMIYCYNPEKGEWVLLENFFYLTITQENMQKAIELHKKEESNLYSQYQQNKSLPSSIKKRISSGSTLSAYYTKKLLATDFNNNLQKINTSPFPTNNNNNGNNILNKKNAILQHQPIYLHNFLPPFSSPTIKQTISSVNTIGGNGLFMKNPIDDEKDGMNTQIKNEMNSDSSLDGYSTIIVQNETIVDIINMINNEYNNPEELKELLTLIQQKKEKPKEIKPPPKDRYKQLVESESSSSSSSSSSSESSSSSSDESSDDNDKKLAKKRKQK